MTIEALSGSGFNLSSMRAKLEQADADKSGGLSLEEFETAQADSGLESVDSADQASAEEVFSMLDADGDGQLTTTEVSSALSGNMSADSFMSLLMAQESASTASAAASAGRSNLTAAYGSQDDSENDLLGDLIDSLDEDSDEKEAA